MGKLPDVRRGWSQRVLRPERLLPLAFVLAVTVGTVLLMLPWARRGPGGADALTALFTSTSAVCVTGLTVVDTATYWTFWGQFVIMMLILVGGLGITAFATLIVLSIAGRLGLQTRLAAQRETKTLALGDVGRVLVAVFVTMMALQVAVAAVLTVRFLVSYDEPLPRALWDGVFHSVSASNNAGFSIYSDNLVRYVADPVVVVAICLAIIVGGIGFPVILEMRRAWRRPRSWSVHTRLTVWTTAALLLAGVAVMVLFEWDNPATLGRFDPGTKALASVFGAVQPRTAGFNTVDVQAMNQETLFATIGLMFVGGGSAGTAGGIKVTTFAVLLFVVLAEVRGDPDVNVARRRVATETQRQAVGVTLVGLVAVAAGAMLIMTTSQVPFGPALFEATSAFGTVGLSIGVSPELTSPGRLALVVLMFIGRVGPVATFSFFALRSTRTRYRYPQARPLVG
jgi:potassium uptake TrkH family protein